MAVEQIKLLGEKRLRNAIEELKDGMQRRVMKSAVGAGLQPIKRAAKASVPHPALRRMVKVKTRKGKKGGIVGKVFLGGQSTRTISWNGRDVSFAVVGAFYEFGTPKMPPTFWMRRAMSGAKRQAFTELTKKARERLKAEVKRANKQGRDIHK